MSAFLSYPHVRAGRGLAVMRREGMRGKNRATMFFFNINPILSTNLTKYHPLCIYHKV